MISRKSDSYAPIIAFQIKPQTRYQTKLQLALHRKQIKATANIPNAYLHLSFFALQKIITSEFKFPFC